MPSAVSRRALRTRSSSTVFRRSIPRRSLRRTCRSAPSARSGAGAGSSGSSQPSSHGSGWKPAILWNTRKTGRPTGVISNGRRSRKPWSTTGPSWQHRQQAEESYMMAPKLRTSVDMAARPWHKSAITLRATYSPYHQMWRTAPLPGPQARRD
jgi:hypothetical protein